MCPRRCRWVMDCWTFSPYGLFRGGIIAQDGIVGLCIIGLSVLCGLFCVIDYLPKVIPLGYVLLGFQLVWIIWG